MASPNDEAVEFKVRRATAQNALQKISGIVEEERKIEASKNRYARIFMRSLFVLFALLVVSSLRFFGVI